MVPFQEICHNSWTTSNLPSASPVPWSTVLLISARSRPLACATKEPSNHPTEVLWLTRNCREMSRSQAMQSTKPKPTLMFEEHKWNSPGNQHFHSQRCATLCLHRSNGPVKHDFFNGILSNIVSLSQILQNSSTGIANHWPSCRIVNHLHKQLSSQCWQWFLPQYIRFRPCSCSVGQYLQLSLAESKAPKQSIQVGLPQVCKVSVLSPSWFCHNFSKFPMVSLDWWRCRSLGLRFFTRPRFPTRFCQTSLKSEAGAQRDSRAFRISILRESFKKEKWFLPAWFFLPVPENNFWRFSFQFAPCQK